MNRTNAQSTLVPDALAMIAACANSRPLMELAVALRAIVTGTLLLPADRVDTISRITRDLANSQWCLQAYLTLNDPRVKYYAKAFCRACIQAVPLTAENPTRDLVWHDRVKTTLIQDASLQSHAKLLLEHVRLRVTLAQEVTAPATQSNATPPHKYDKTELHAKAKQFAEEILRRHQAQKAQAAANTPLAVTSVPEPKQPPEPAQPDIPTVSEFAPTPTKRRVFRNAAGRARYLSMPTNPSLCFASAIRDQFRPGLS